MGIQDRNYVRERKLDYSDHRQSRPPFIQKRRDRTLYYVAFWLALFAALYGVAVHVMP